MKRLNRTHLFVLSAVFVLTLATAQSASAMDHRNVAVGPDGTTYVLAERMDMMGGMGDPDRDDRGMDLTLYAIGRDNRVLWSYRLEGGEATAPVVGSDSTVYVAVFPMREGHEGQNGPELGRAKLYAIRGGSLKWSIEFKEQMPSAPVLGPNGTIYISTNGSMAAEMDDDDDMDQGERNGGAALLAFEDRQTSAVLLWSRELDAMMLSEPVVQVISPTDWTISVSGFLRERDGMGGDMMGDPVLFRFRPDGSFQTIRLARGGHM
ncbi:MAG: PQQ-like beta-propeller repeat protein [Acidobacteria bacterium]|nr:PQQ-like beta-propeller repeat protein [Acidobacteriota bacterium]